MTVEIEVNCAICGEELEAELSMRGRIAVTPCDRCLKEAVEEGYSEGHEDGENEGYEKGKDNAEKE